MPASKAGKRKAKDPVSETRSSKSKKKTASIPTPSTLCLPVEVIRSILQYANPSTLHKCMQVSKEFNQVAGPLLYSNVIIQNSNSNTKLLEGNDVVDWEEDKFRGRTNCKTNLLSMVRQLTVFSHTCKRSGAPISLPSLQTLLIIPQAGYPNDEWVCGTKDRCSIINAAEPRKVVIHNCRRTFAIWRSQMTIWPLCAAPFPVSCSILTLIIDEVTFMRTIPYDNFHPPYADTHHRSLQELRIIVPSQTPAWLDQISRRESSKHDTSDLSYLAGRVLAPVLFDVSSRITIYLFRPLAAEDDLARLRHLIDKALEYYSQCYHHLIPSASTPTYCIKTLADYIEERLEDEFLTEELQFWREENQRRLQVERKENERASSDMAEHDEHDDECRSDEGGGRE